MSHWAQIVTMLQHFALKGLRGFAHSIKMYHFSLQAQSARCIKSTKLTGNSQVFQFLFYMHLRSSLDYIQQVPTHMPRR